MITTTQLRLFRLRHKIVLPELAEKANISRQQLSRLELSVVTPTVYQEEKITEAVNSLIAERRSALLTLEQDYLNYRGRFLETLEVPRDEL